MHTSKRNFAFIDAQNLHLGVKDQGWTIDYRRFRRYLKEKYGVTEAFLFIGYRAGNERLYEFLQRAGYLCVFKPTLELPNGEVKGNVDAELVLHSMIEYQHYEKAVIVTGDGDFRCLIAYLLEQDKLEKTIIPNAKKYSALLKSLSAPDRNIFAFMNGLREKLGRDPARTKTNEDKKEKGSSRDKTLQEPLSS